MITCPYCGHTIDSLGERVDFCFSYNDPTVSAGYITCCDRCGAIIKWREEYTFSGIKDVEIAEEP